MTRLGGDEPDFVLLNRAKATRYHRAVRTAFGYAAACGTSGLMHQMDESVAVGRYKRTRVVRAGYDAHSDRVLWVRVRSGWYSETQHGFHAYFAALHDPEVLRVGIGETYPHASGDAVVLGPETIRSPKGTVITHKGENYYPLARGAV